jgi:O-antigen/teichoic acid export membrane protein
MTMTGHERGAAILLVCCALANAAATSLLIPAYGLAGAATATTGTLIFWNASMAIYLRQFLGLKPGLATLWRRPRDVAREGGPSGVAAVTPPADGQG